MKHNNLIRLKIVTALNKATMFKELRVCLQIQKRRVLAIEIKKNINSIAKKEKKNYKIKYLKKR